MYPLITYLYNSILKRYLRYLFLKYLVSCNKIRFLLTVSCNKILIFASNSTCNKILF